MGTEIDTTRMGIRGDTAIDFATLKTKAARRLALGLRSQVDRYGLRRDLGQSIENPTARIPISVRPARRVDLDSILSGEGVTEAQEKQELNARRSFAEKVGGGAYVAIDERNGTPCYVQWLLGPQKNRVIGEIGGFPLLAEGEALLEDAYTPPQPSRPGHHVGGHGADRRARLRPRRAPGAHLRRHKQTLLRSRAARRQGSFPTSCTRSATGCSAPSAPTRSRTCRQAIPAANGPSEPWRKSMRPAGGYPPVRLNRHSPEATWMPVLCGQCFTPSVRGLHERPIYQPRFRDCGAQRLAVASYGEAARAAGQGNDLRFRAGGYAQAGLKRGDAAHQAADDGAADDGG
jgi:hypothetical protein